MTMKNPRKTRKRTNHRTERVMIMAKIKTKITTLILVPTKTRQNLYNQEMMFQLSKKKMKTKKHSNNKTNDYMLSLRQTNLKL